MNEIQLQERLARIEAKLDMLVALMEICEWPAESYAIHEKHPWLWTTQPIGEQARQRDE